MGNHLNQNASRRNSYEFAMIQLIVERGIYRHLAAQFDKIYQSFDFSHI